jgi:hypothetical protein
MSWRAALLGALIVVVAGAVAGAAIGGKTNTRYLTTTVVRTVKVIKAAATNTSTTSTTPGGVGAGGSTTGSASSGGEKSAPAGSQETYLAEYLRSQGGPETLNRNAEDASMLDNADQQQLAGQTYQHAVAFQVDGQSESLSASYQIPTPGFSRLSSTAIGLQTTTNANTSYKLTVYKNNDNSPNSAVLYQASFHGPSTVHKMSFALQGATDVLLVWTHKATEPDSQDTFIIADPVVTG